MLAIELEARNGKLCLNFNISKYIAKCIPLITDANMIMEFVHRFMKKEIASVKGFLTTAFNLYGAMNWSIAAIHKNIKFNTELQCFICRDNVRKQ